MEEIRLLDKELINMIAAGEVVERPASVIKELVENSIDAKAVNIIVEIKNGGKTYIRVTDDGVGMSEADAQTAFIRHATSKISTKDDLFAINTMGFRGEALAAIAAVSKVEINTHAKSAEHGIRMFLDAGRELYRDEVGLPIGTTIFVKDLFYNIPVRMNFLKKDSTETANIVSLVNKLAIGNPDISFKLIVDGKLTLSTEKNSDLINIIYTVLGKEISDNMLPVSLSEKDITIEGYVGKPKCNRSNRNFQLFYVNGRVVKNKTITAALDRAYHNSLMNGRHAVAVIKITVPPKRVDVNVHPTKTEIKFSDDQKVFDAVYYSVKNALDLESGVKVKKESKIDDDKPFDPEQPDRTQFERAVEEYNKGVNASTYIQPAFEIGSLTQTEPPAAFIDISGQPDSPSNMYAPSYIEIVSKLAAAEGKEVDITKNIVADPGLYTRNDNINQEELSKEYSYVNFASELTLFDAEIAFKFIGELFKTYIIVECADNFYFIDKHAAHEKILFDKIYEKYKNSDRYSQTLLSGIPVTLSPEENDTVWSNKDKIEQMGFTFDKFGNNEIVLRSIPYVMSSGDTVSTFVQLIDLISQNKNTDITEFENQAIKMFACKAAIKAGFDTSEYEMQEFIKEIIKTGNVNYCPHGRPIICEFSRKGLEKAFKRIV